MLVARVRFFFRKITNIKHNNALQYAQCQYGMCGRLRFGSTAD